MTDEIKKLRDEAALACTGYEINEPNEGLNLIALDQCVGFMKGFDKCYEVMTERIAALERENARLVQEVVNRNQYKINQEYLDNIHKHYEALEAVAEGMAGALKQCEGPFLYSGTSSPVSDAEALDAIEIIRRDALATWDEFKGGEK